MSGDGDRLRQITLAEDLDAIGAALDDAAVAQRALVDLRSGVEQLELADVDRGDDVAVVLLEAALRETTRHGRLAAFEPRLERGATGVLALLTATRGLAEARADAATPADLVAGG